MSLTTPPNSWPAVLIGLILLIYWLRVLQMVAHTRQTTGRAANFVPPEPLGRIVRIVWIPVVALWVLVPLFTPFIIHPVQLLQPLEAIYANLWVGWIAATLAAVALAVTWACWVRMGSSWRMGIDPGERTRLVFNGPYAYVRHPIYALSSLLMILAVIAVPSPLMVLVGVLHLLFLQWEARREEHYLLMLHGQPYADYIARVGRFIPRLAGHPSSIAV